MHKLRANRKKNELLRITIAARCGNGLTKQQQDSLKKRYTDILMSNRRKSNA